VFYWELLEADKFCTPNRFLGALKSSVSEGELLGVVGDALR